METVRVPRTRRPDYWFSIDSPRVCSGCSTVFIPRATKLKRALTFIVGVVFIVAPMAVYCVPAIVAFASNGWSARWLVKLILGTTTLILGVCIVRTALKSGSHRTFSPGDYDVTGPLAQS